MAKKFVPAADEVWRLHNLKEEDCLFFQGFCEEGHYGGPRGHGTTRQGIYCCSPSGKFLASVNTTDPKRMARMLEEALDAWRAMPRAERYLKEDPAKTRDAIRRSAEQYPEDGLPLRVYARDMPRKNVPSDWRRDAWNVDSFWLRAAEARSLLPAKLSKGKEVAWPEALIHRLTTRGLVDNVRGQTNGYRDEHILEARMITRVTEVKRSLITVAFEGVSRTSTTGTWPKDGKASSAGGSGAFERGVSVTLLGTAIFDKRSGRFTKFELSGAGTRFGRTRFNFREDDVDEAPIGFAVTFVPEDPGNRVAPAELRAYGW